MHSIVRRLADQLAMCVKLICPKPLLKASAIDKDGIEIPRVMEAGGT